MTETTTRPRRSFRRTATMTAAALALGGGLSLGGQAAIAQPAAAATNCNQGGMPIKWGKCYDQKRSYWQNGGSTFDLNRGQWMTRWYKVAKTFWSGIPGGWERTGESLYRPSSWGRP